MVHEEELETWSHRKRATKRSLDIVFALLASIAYAIPMLFISIWIKYDSSGPILFWQERIGRNGTIIKVPKFRTMSHDVESSNRKTVTDAGKLLRKTHLDELPQIYSVIQGDMSFVGPRPIWSEENESLEQKISEWNRRHKVKPGITGPCQIKGIDTTEPERLLMFDLYYIRNFSALLDLKIVLKQSKLIFKSLYSQYKV